MAKENSDESTVRERGVLRTFIAPEESVAKLSGATHRIASEGSKFHLSSIIQLIN